MKKEYICTWCIKVCSGQSKLQTHVMTHTGEKRFSCPKCDKSYSQSSCLKIHIRNNTGEKPFICQVCDKSYISSTQLRLHQKQHFKEKYFLVTFVKNHFLQQLLKKFTKGPTLDRSNFPGHTSKVRITNVLMSSAL